MDPNIAQQRSIHRAFEDGVEELYIGLFALVMGGVYLVSFKLPKGSTLSQIMAMGASFFQIAFVLTMVAARKKVKAAYVFPRTGYVTFRRGKGQTWMVVAFGIASLGIALATLVWRSSIPDLSRIAGPVSALVMASCLLWGGVKYHFPHMNWLAAYSLLLGAATYFMDARSAGMLWVMLGVGLALALAGAVRFRIFLKTRPIIQAHAISEDGLA